MIRVLTKLAFVSSLVWCSFANQPSRNCNALADGEDLESHNRQLLQVGTSVVGCDTPECQLSLTEKKSVIERSIQPPKIPEPEETVVSTNDRHCDRSEFALSHACPAKCPYAAEMEDKFCFFRCVQGNQCGTMGTVKNATIPSEATGACRLCNVEACKICRAGPPGAKSAELEFCLECYPGYSLTEEGECEMDGLWVFYAITIVGVIAVVTLVAWYLRVVTRPCVNQAGVDYANEARCSSMVLRDDGTPYPLGTNLMTNNVAGVGTMCFFRFQFALLVWALSLLGLWLAFALYVGRDILVLGNRPAKTPMSLCAVVRWGRQRQLELLWVKVAWLTISYVFSFGCAIAYAIQQTKLVHDADADKTTMCEFVALLDGLPPMNGKEPVESLIKEKVAQATGEEVVGVSVAWNYEAKSHDIMEAVESDLCPVVDADTGHRVAPQRSFDTPITKKILSAWHVHLHDDEGHGHGHGDAHSSGNVKDMIENMDSCPVAFVVFKLEAGRDRAIEAVANSGLEINGSVCTLEAGSAEPKEVLWENLAVANSQRTMKVVKGALLVLGSCAAWTVFLYLPYAFYMASFTYARGDEPGEFSEGIFITLVVGSQIGLFVASSIAAKKAQYRYEADVQTMYTLYYNSALVLNLALDIVLQAYLSYIQMVGVGAHTAGGKLLGSLTRFQEIFESYPMQKSVGRLLFKYCWPCTFFVPFLAEPFVAQWLPQHIGRLLIGADPRIKGLSAVKALELSEMEQGRYADVIFNVILVSFIPFIAPAYMHMTFMALIISHVYLYCYDHVKVLRYVVSFDCSSPDVHNLGMKLFSIPLSILAGALVFKANQLTGGEDLGAGVLKDEVLVAAIAGAMALHVILHLALLKAVASKFSTEVDRSESTATYEDTAKLFPATYFSVNPIHCLRSKYGINQKEEVQFYSPLRQPAK